MIYHFASIADAHVSIRHDASLQPGNYAALTRVCVQIRQEYRPIQRRMAEVRLDLSEVRHYARTFLTSAEDCLSLPHKVRVDVPIWGLPRVNSRFDILPVLELKAAHPSLDCKIVPFSGVKDSDCAHRDIFDLAVEQAHDLSALVLHANKTWLDEISNGVIGNVWITSGVSGTPAHATTLLDVIFAGIHTLKNYTEAAKARRAWLSARGLDAPPSHGHRVAFIFNKGTGNGLY